MGIQHELIRIAVCDDEERFRALLMSSIKEILDEKNISTEIEEFETGEKMMELGTGVLDFDVIFLDVDMGEEGGFATAQRIRKMSSEIPIVFVTGILNTWNKGYEVGAFRYIIKDPRTFGGLLKECLVSIMERFYSETPMLKLDTTGGEKDIPIKDVIYLESMGHNIVCHVLINGKYTELKVRNRISKCEKELSEMGFVRIHQSYLVNSGYIEQIKNYKAVIDGLLIELPISKDRYKEVKMAVVAAKGAI